MSQVTWILDTDRCVGCETCTIACVSENNTPPVASPLEVTNLDVAVATTYRWVVRDEGGTYPTPYRRFVTSSCNHCADPACMKACPTGAISKRADGIVLIDQDLCVGCRRCGGVCPYGAPRFNKLTQKTEKCTFCVHRMGADAGASQLEPACVQTCIGRALNWEVAAGPVGAQNYGDRPDGFADPEHTNPSIRFATVGPIQQEGDL